MKSCSKGIPTTTVILITCVVGIPRFMIKKPIKNRMPSMGSMIVVDIPYLTGFLIINSGIPTTHVFNITVVVGILLLRWNVRWQSVLEPVPVSPSFLKTQYLK